MSQLQSVLMLLGRILIGIPALFFGIILIVYWSEISQILEGRHIPVTWVWIILAILFLFIGSVSIILGYKARIGAILLMLTLIGSSFTLDGFWNPTQSSPPNSWIICNNMAIFGGLIYLFTFGSGSISLDKKERKREIL
ncbi:MAG: DoxX family protein [Parachlamydiales bacterium]